MKKLLTIIMLLGTAHLFAQPFAVTGLNISMPTSPDANTANWGVGASPFSISAQAKLDSNRQVNPFVMESKILVTIKKGGGKVCGTYTNASAPASNFNSAFKVWNGRNGVSLLGQDCVLPAGEYELCVQFFGSRNGALTAFSDEKCKFFTIADTKQESFNPPQNIMPVNDKVLTEQASNMPITFRWTQVLPKPQGDVQYKVSLWEKGIGMSNSQAIKNTPAEVFEVKNNTQLIAKLAQRCNDCDYVWNVTATGTERVQGGEPRSYGVSEATGFSVKSVDPIPVKYNPPVNQSPADGKVFTKKEIVQPIAFRWTPVLPTPKENITYRLRVWMLKNGQSPSDAIKNNVPALTTETNALIHTPGVCDTIIRPCECFPGCDHSPYIWNVQALLNGKIIAESEAFTFSVSSAGCGTNTDRVNISCKGWENGKPVYTVSITFTNIVPTSGGQQCTTVMNAITSSTGVISGLATLPVTIPSGGTSPAVTFTYTPSASGATTASFLYQGLWNDGSGNTSNFTNSNVQLPKCNTTPACNCKSVQCTKKLWYKDLTTGTTTEFNCNTQTPIVLNCNKNYHFFATAACSPDTSCKMIVKGEFRNAAGALVIQQTPFNSTNSAFNIISSTPGNYKFIIKYYINDVVCDSCTIPITVSCNPPADCCKNGNWYNKTWFNGPSVSNGSGRPPVQLPAPGTNMGTWPCAVPSYTFHCSFVCANNCAAAQINYSIYNSANGSLISSQTVQSAAYANIPAITTNGNYLLVIAAICGKDTCNKIQYPFVINCTSPTNCCQNATQKDPSVYDEAGKNLATLSCAQPKLFNINKANNNCGKELIIKASANCGPDTNCRAKVVYTLKNTVTGAIISGIGILTIPASLANGDYTLTVRYYCGDIICKTCKFEIRKDCPPQNNDCCKGSRWIKAEYQITNKKPNGDWDKSDQTYYPLPLTIGSPIPILKADVAIDLERLVFSCAEGCTSGFILKRKNITTGVEETPEIITAGGTPSVYAKAYPQLITIIPTCGGDSCGNPINFKLELKTDTCGNWGPVYYWANGEPVNTHVVTNDTIYYQPCNNCLTFSFSYNCGKPGCTSEILCDYPSPWNFSNAINPSVNCGWEGPIILHATCCGKECGTKNLFLKRLPCPGAKKSSSKSDEIIVGGQKQKTPNSNGSKSTGGTQTTDKGWDGHIHAKGAVSLPYPCTCCGKSIELTSGQSAVDHKASCCPPPPVAPTSTVGKAILNNCPPPCDWDTLVPGGPEFRQGLYVVSDGILNGKKELMSNIEVNTTIERVLQFGARLVFRGAIVKKHKLTGLTVLIAYYTCCPPIKAPSTGDKSGTDDRIETITIPLKEEKGYLKMSGVAFKETIVAGKTTITSLPEIKSKKHDYVGHVTLLR